MTDPLLDATNDRFEAVVARLLDDLGHLMEAERVVADIRRSRDAWSAVTAATSGAQAVGAITNQPGAPWDADILAWRNAGIALGQPGSSTLLRLVTIANHWRFRIGLVRAKVTPETEGRELSAWRAMARYDPLDDWQDLVPRG